MTLASQLETIEPAIRGPKCSAGLLLDELDEPDRLALIAAMNDPRKMASDIHRILKANGLNIAVAAIRRHRVTPTHPRECACHD